MAVTTTLSTTTLADACSATDKQIKLVSASGLTPGMCLWIDKELVKFTSFGLSNSFGQYVNVTRGVDGTTSTPHNQASTVTLGRADQFYTQDPVGPPPLAVPVSPYINTTNGKVWLAQGDDVPGTRRWWQEVTTTYGVGALGVRTTTFDPTSST